MLQSKKKQTEGKLSLAFLSTTSLHRENDFYIFYHFLKKCEKGI